MFVAKLVNAGTVRSYRAQYIDESIYSNRNQPTNITLCLPGFAFDN